MLVSRLLVALPLLAVILALLIWGTPLLWKVTTAVVALGAAWEWARLSGFAGGVKIAYLILFAVFLALGDVLLADNALASTAVFAGACFFWMIAAPFYILAGGRWYSTVFGGVGMGALFVLWHASVVLFVHHWYTLLAALVMVWVADTAAYAAGKMMGKTPLAPTVSPNKTWEGFLGGLFAVWILAYVAGPLFFSLPRFLLLVVVFALLALSVLGDLFESAAKRHCGTKDSGTLLGGHGGILDRLDALLPVLPFAALMSPFLA